MLHAAMDTEIVTLLAFQNIQRRHALGILEGLGEDDLRRPVLPSGWTCLGLISHLALDIERFWFRAVVAGPEVSEPRDFGPPWASSTLFGLGQASLSCSRSRNALLARRGAIGLNDLAQHSGVRLEPVSNLVDLLDDAGRIRRNAAGEVVGSGGLSVIPDRHEVELDGRRFWTWCAYDILGIFGVTGATGRAVSPSPPDGRPMVLHFTRGRPDKHDAVLFPPDENLMTSCENVYEQWCPNSNLFASRELAEHWAGQHGLQGRVLDLDEASDLVTKEWGDVI